MPGSRLGMGAGVVEDWRALDAAVEARVEAEMRLERALRERARRSMELGAGMMRRVGVGAGMGVRRRRGVMGRGATRVSMWG